MPEDASSHPPAGYAALNQLVAGKMRNVLAVIASSRPYKRTCSGFVKTCFLTDASLPFRHEIMANIFRPTMDLTTALKPGSIVDLANVKVQNFNSRQQIVATNASKIKVYRDDLAKAVDQDKPEIASYIYQLKLWWDTKSALGPTGTYSTPDDIHNYTPSMSFRLFQSIEPGMFVDLAVEVIRVWPQSAKCTQLIVSDYTENKLARPTSRKLEGEETLSGRQFDFAVALWDEHATSRFVLGAKEGNSVATSQLQSQAIPFGAISMRVYPLPDALSDQLSTRKAEVIKGLKQPRSELETPKELTPPLTELTQVRYAEAPICNLDQVLACAQVPNHYRVKARILEVWPGDDERGISSLCRRTCTGCESIVAPEALECQFKCKDKSLSWTYRFAFKLAPTDQDAPVLPVLVSHQDAVRYTFCSNP
ncbi:hypothetical protein L0F63_007219 [Massospora cicadina]|nr:hypothetical protein L0F63_007219 [Massospora cicadina]